MTTSERTLSVSIDPKCEKPVVLHTRVVTGTGGGPEKTILNSPRFLERLGYLGLCAYMHPPKDPGFNVLRDRAEKAGATLYSVPDRGIWDLSVFRQLLTICQENNVSIWHGHDYKSNFIGLMLRRIWPMKLLTTSHGWVKFTSRTPVYHAVDRYCQRRYDRVICVSQDIQQICLNHGVRPSKCRVIDNAIDVEQNRRAMEIHQAKNNLGWPTDQFVVGAVGRLSPEKGFDLLITAVSQLIEEGYPVRLVIAGEGDARDSLERLIQEQASPERFQLLGHRNDIPQLLQGLDIFALSSLREGLPNVVLEAMAYEVPVLATRIAGIPRLIQNQKNGLLVEPGQAKFLANGLRELLTNPELRLSYAAAGRATIESDFSFQSRMEKIASVYDELLKQP